MPLQWRERATEKSGKRLIKGSPCGQLYGTVYSLARTTQKPTASALPDFRSIFESYGPFVARALRQLEVPSADRHDLRQEIFVIVHRRMHEYDGRTSLRS